MTPGDASAEHPFDAAITLQEEITLQGESGRYQGRTTPPYANMVGPFGGILAANMLQAILQHPDCQGQPLALTVNFVAPVADGDFTVIAAPIRTNRSTQHWWVTLSQQDQVAVSATAITALRRDTWSVSEASMPSAPAPDQVPQQPQVPMIPTLFGNYEMRVIRGNIAPLPQYDPYPEAVATAAASGESLLWVRDQPPRPLDFPALAALCDIFYPRIFIYRQRPCAAGTVTMTVHFHATLETLAEQGDQLLLGHARALRFDNGFADQQAELWSASGELLATTQQSVYYKE